MLELRLRRMARAGGPPSECGRSPNVRTSLHCVEKGALTDWSYADSLYLGKFLDDSSTLSCPSCSSLQSRSELIPPLSQPMGFTQER